MALILDTRFFHSYSQFCNYVCSLPAPILPINYSHCQDRAIAQLEEALASRQRAIEQLIAATSSTEQLNTELQDRDAQVCGLCINAVSVSKMTALLNECITREFQFLE